VGHLGECPLCNPTVAALLTCHLDGLARHTNMTVFFDVSEPRPRREFRFEPTAGNGSLPHESPPHREPRHAPVD
jgi:hypothetical protein